MLIDWFTVLAQVVNFLVLVLVLKWLLYRPILKAMREREQRIGDRLHEAEDSRLQALEQKKMLEQEKSALESRSSEFLAQAREDTRLWREKALADARKEVEDHRQAWLERLQAEKDHFYSSLKNRIAEQVLQVSAKALQDLADETLEHRLAESFLEKLAGQAGRDGSPAPGRPAVIRTGFPPSEATRALLESRLPELYPGISGLDFRERPDLGFGIELFLDNTKTEWNLRQYMRGLEKDVLESFLPVSIPQEDT